MPTGYDWCGGILCCCIWMEIHGSRYSGALSPYFMSILRKYDSYVAFARLFSALFRALQLIGSDITGTSAFHKHGYKKIANPKCRMLFTFD